MENTFNIRFYKPEDYSQVKAIYQGKGAWFREGVDDEERLRTKIKRDPESILVAEKAGKVVGTISLIEDGRHAFIVRLAVLESERDKGIGSKLLQEAERILMGRGLKKINILVSETEEDLYDYYEKRGYKRGLKHLWMYKDL